MANTTTSNLRINPTLKKQAEEILSELGIPMSIAINMYLRQICMTDGISFSVELPKVPKEINADYENGRVTPADEKPFLKNSM